MPPSASVRINSFTTDICKCPPGLVFCGVSFVCENHTIIEKILPYNLWNFILFFLKNLKCNLFLIHSSRNGIAFFHFSVQDGFCERILNFALDRAF